MLTSPHVKGKAARPPIPASSHTAIQLLGGLLASARTDSVHTSRAEEANSNDFALRKSDCRYLGRLLAKKLRTRSNYGGDGDSKGMSLTSP